MGLALKKKRGLFDKINRKNSYGGVSIVSYAFGGTF